MTTHVFVVDENTFKYHLEYKFAGTGAKDKKSPFLYDSGTNSIHSTTEINLVGMIADVSKIRIGDKIIFYLQARGYRQGMFFGVFKASSRAFFDENDADNYLLNQLGKGLSFRILIEPYIVFPLGITEHEYLDSLEGKEFPYQMCWSLIYRKLKGNRGCTMITDYEYKDLLRKLKVKNKNITIDSLNLSFDAFSESIVASNCCNNYDGRRFPIEIGNRMIYKANRNNAFESHLQAYILQNFDVSGLKEILLPIPESSCWLGNEVSCGVGMQRIDIMIKQETETEIYMKIIELKCIEPYKEILTFQIPWYLEWVNDYVVPNYRDKKCVHIIPCVLAKNTNSSYFIEEARKSDYKDKAKLPNTIIEPLEYIGFDILNDSIEFKKVL